eukprot:scaffold1140_cov157-Amphora_coffeaeformis.AAC.9
MAHLFMIFVWEWRHSSLQYARRRILGRSIESFEKGTTLRGLFVNDVGENAVWTLWALRVAGRHRRLAFATLRLQ